jgi:septal ring factor EnvC (AmiA/AmiB activator)
MSHTSRRVSIRVLIAALLAGALATAVALPSHAASISGLSAQLNAEQAHQQSLSATVARLSQTISSLDSQIALVQQRENAVRADLARDQATLARTRVQLARERRLIEILKARLARARMILARQLVSSYESDRPDLVSVVLEAHGFTDLLEQFDFLKRAQSQQQQLIAITTQAKAQADAAERKLSSLETTQARVAQEVALRARALAGMGELLRGKQAAVAQARAAQQAALQASRAKGAQLQAEISKLQAQQAAAARAAASAATSTSSSGSSAPTSSGPALGPSGGWAIPYAIVLCESGGQNLPPNSAGASGYYQILASTWKAYGGTGPAAYLAPKSEQDAVAARIWDGGRGASAWVCAGIVGIH